jgi:hypothetical protein
MEWEWPEIRTQIEFTWINEAFAAENIWEHQ